MVLETKMYVMFFRKEVPVFFDNFREKAGVQIFLKASKKSDYSGLAM
jgi:hypothetical protein